MPKTVQYKKGAVIYCEEEHTKYIYILQHGSVEVSYFNAAAQKYVAPSLVPGDFFGVKSTLLGLPHTSKAIATSDSTIIFLTLDEFENIFTQDGKLALRMMKAFSVQLMQMHASVYKKFGIKKETNCEHGMYLVAKGFFDAKEYTQCIYQCERFLTAYPQSRFKEKIDTILSNIETVDDEIKASGPPIFFADLQEFELSLPDSFERYERELSPYEIIFSEFEKGDSFFLVLSGVVRSTKYVRGLNVNLSLAMPGEFFGLNKFINESTRDVTCVATSPATILEFKSEDFEALILENPKIGYLMLKLLAKRAHDDRIILRNLYIPELPYRLKDMFVALDDLGLCEKQKDAARKIYLTPHYISVWLNEPVEKIQEELEKQEQQGVLLLFDDWIIVKDIEELRRISKGKRLELNKN